MAKAVRMAMRCAITVVVTVLTANLVTPAVGQGKRPSRVTIILKYAFPQACLTGR